MRDIAIGLFLLLMGAVLGWATMMQHRTREPSGETVFDIVGAVVPILKRPMLWLSTLFLGLLAVVALIGAMAFLMKAMGFE